MPQHKNEARGSRATKSGGLGEGLVADESTPVA